MADTDPEKVSEHRGQSPEDRNLFDIFWMPIGLLLFQVCFLAAAIFFLVWTYLGDHPVPPALGRLYSKHPQSSTTVLTLFGTILGWITTKLFAFAVRIAINVSLRKKGLPLYRISVASKIASSSILFDWDRGRNWNWVLVTIFYFVVFFVQTSAWTTIITPKPGVVRSIGNFDDFDLTTPVLANGSLVVPFAFTAFWQAAASGLTAVRDIAAGAGAIDISTGPPTDTTRNISRLLPYSNFALTGTSAGILPQIPSSAYNGGWARIETVQQGITANVDCLATSTIATPRLSVNEAALNVTPYLAVSLGCDGRTDGISSTVVNSSASSYGFFTVCPYQGTDNSVDNITLYLIIGGAGFFNHQNFLFSCNIQPQRLDVAVTYNNTGVVSIERSNQTQALPVGSSSAISSIIGALENHLAFAQSPDMNTVIDPIYTIYDDYQQNKPSKADLTTQAELIAGYIQGVIEDAATNLRIALFSFSEDAIPRQPIQANIFANTPLWGPAFSTLRLDVIMVSPFVIMVSNILIILISLIRIHERDLKRNMFQFNPTSALDVIVACKNGDMGKFPFPQDDHDVDRDSKTVIIALYEGERKNNGIRLTRP